MTPFVRVEGIAAPMPGANIDTDQIVPKQFLKTITRAGLGRALFFDQRVAADGTAIAGFVLDTPPYDRAVILVAGDNFGCGSSREHAPWALMDFGIRAMIATSFADIFYNNSVNNGLLPVVLEAPAVAVLMAAAQAGERLGVDLEARLVTTAGRQYPFTIDPAVRAKLLAGIDAIGDTLRHGDRIDRIEARLDDAMPWLPQRPPGGSVIR